MLLLNLLIVDGLHKQRALINTIVIINAVIAVVHRCDHEEIAVSILILKLGSRLVHALTAAAAEQLIVEVNKFGELCLQDELLALRVLMIILVMVVEG